MQTEPGSDGPADSRRKHLRRYDPDEAPQSHGAGLRGNGEPGLLLLRDLRALHLLYAEASIDWVILGQGAQAARDTDLLDTVSSCHTRTLRGMKWTVTRLKAVTRCAHRRRTR
jgi:hypothetical protein